MKKAAVLFLILALLCGVAFADSADGIVVRNGEYAAFLDEHGNIYLSGYAEPINATKAESLVDIDESRVLFHPLGDAEKLISLSLDGFVESAYDGSAPDRRGYAGEGFQIYENKPGELCLLEDGAKVPLRIASNVLAWAVVGRNIYYILGEDGTKELAFCDIDTRKSDFVILIPKDFEPQLTASLNSLFVLSSSNVIYSVDVKNAELVQYATLSDPESYGQSDGRPITGYRIEAVSGQLSVYGVKGDAEDRISFKFATQTNSGEASQYVLLCAYSISQEDTTWDLLHPGSAQSEEYESQSAPEESDDETFEDSSNETFGDSPDESFEDSSEASSEDRMREMLEEAFGESADESFEDSPEASSEERMREMLEVAFG